MPKSWEQILDGYTTHTLTEVERHRLFRVVLRDKPLFDAFADEKALRVLLANPEERQRILERLRTAGRPKPPSTFSTRGFPWLPNPTRLAWGGGLVVIVLLLFIGWQLQHSEGPVVKEGSEGPRSVERVASKISGPSIGEESGISIQPLESQAFESFPAEREQDLQDSSLTLEAISTKDPTNSQALGGLETAKENLEEVASSAPNRGAFSDFAGEAEGSSTLAPLDLFYAQFEDDAEEGRGSVKGIRYSFILNTAKGIIELGEARNIRGDWKDVRLAIESNQPGYLYVMAEVGRHKWDLMEAEPLVGKRGPRKAGEVKPYEAREYRVGVFRNLLGNLTISSITLLLSPRPLANSGPWLEDGQVTPGVQVERTEDSVYVVQTGGVSDVPLRVDIPLPS